MISQTGVDGLALGGSVGWLTRTARLSLDSLTAVDLATATGSTCTPEDENSELFWGIRGCGGNFGVVISFTFRTMPVPEGVLGANLFYRLENWGRDLPDGMNPIISILVLPPEMEMGSDPGLIVGRNWFGDDRRAGMDQLDRLRETAPPTRRRSARWTGSPGRAP